MKMNKKEFRKELELALEKVIVDVLIKRNSDAAKEVMKSIHSSSKVIAKKFHKALKPKEVIIAPPTTAQKNIVAKSKPLAKSRPASKSKSAAKTKKASNKK